MDSGFGFVAKQSKQHGAFKVQVQVQAGSGSGTSPVRSGLEPISPGITHGLTFKRRSSSSSSKWNMCNFSTQTQPQPQPQAQDAAWFGDIEPRLAAETPQHPACTEALVLAQSLPVSVFNHSYRVFIYARRALSRPAGPAAAFTAPPVAPHVLFVACILHDIGIADAYRADPERFEVAGANVAASLLRRHGVDVTSVREAWLAIAMHTSPHVAEGAGGLANALRLGVRADFGTYDHLGPSVFGGEGCLPRLGVEKELGDAVVEQALAFPSKAPGGSWPRDLTRAKEAEPECDGINKAF
ncbi:hypothetical protein KVR01_003620 [Diaporthe batatas]|uniref:uncharacterized protein n=1 Tax=Diaporthe batatas TaxID=748121 RepID=UPI001D0524C8|nr:uncharacterized protein KVR01_003620 [Diaporthe batatas]KAG8167931.1 hypothetical protein KVR01_003620 [Diaporthe batatas]